MNRERISVERRRVGPGSTSPRAVSLRRVVDGARAALKRGKVLGIRIVHHVGRFISTTRSIIVSLIADR
jgi:hypothetical protein